MKNAVKTNIRAHGALRGNFYSELKNQHLTLIAVYFVSDVLRASLDKTENSIGKRLDGTRFCYFYDDF